MMKTRKLLIGLLTAGAFSVGFGAAVFPASAELRTLTVTLLGGEVITVAVDVPPNTPLEQIKIPGVEGTIVSVSEANPPASVSAPAAEQTAPADPAATTPQSPTPEAPQETKPSQAPSHTVTAEKARPKRERSSKGSADLDPEAIIEGGSPAASDGSKADAPTTGDKPSPTRDAGGAPTPANPSFSLSLPGPAPMGVPNFFIEKFRIPPFLLPIYQAAGIEYGVRWEVLAAINEIETDYGRNLNVSSAGALGWMQFIPSTWKMYGVDANKDGRKDPFNPVDAIFGAARYLKAAGGDKDIRKAVFAYNHADWYVDSVLMRARLIGGLPADLIGSLTGLTQGHFPVHGKARYADDISERDAQRRVARGKNAAIPVEASQNRRAVDIFAKPGAPVLAVQDGKIIRMGTNERLGKFIQLRDVYGNTYTYGNLKKFALAHPVPKQKTVSKDDVAKELDLPKRDPKPAAPASAGKQPVPAPRASNKVTRKPVDKVEPVDAPKVAKQRLFANPSRPKAYKSGGEEQLLNSDAELNGYTTFKSFFTEVYGLKRSDVELKRLKKGSTIIAGTILGRIGKTDARTSPHVRFEIRPAGRGAPRIDPKPILDGWKLLESTAVYRAAGKNPFFGPDAKNPTIGQVLLMSKEALQRRVLTNPRIDTYQCGRRDIRAGIVDRRVLATLEFLSASGLKPTVTSLRCGHGYLTAGGNVSQHSSGNAVDVAKVNGIPILGHQGEGSVTELAIRRLLTLQGTMKPDQIISLMTFEGADNTLALADHNDHIHIGFRPLYATGSKEGRKLDAVLKPSQWIKLIDRIGSIENPEVSTEASKYSLKVKPPKRASRSHAGE